MAADSTIKPPPGFVLDKPQPPPGFVLDSGGQSEPKPYVSPRYGPTGATAMDVASDQAAEVLKGIPEAITGIPGAVAQLVKMGWKSLTQPGSSEQQQQLLNMGKGILQPFVTTGKQAIEL